MSGEGAYLTGSITWPLRRDLVILYDWKMQFLIPAFSHSDRMSNTVSS